MASLDDLGLFDIQCEKCGIDLRLNTISLEYVKTHNPYCFDVDIKCQNCGHVNKKKYELEEVVD